MCIRDSICSEEALAHFDRCRFTGTVWPEERGYLATGNSEREIVHRSGCAEPFCDVSQLYRCGGTRCGCVAHNDLSNQCRPWLRVSMAVYSTESVSSFSPPVLGAEV